MNPSKKDFFSLNLNENIIKFQVTLWNKYCDARKMHHKDWMLEQLNTKPLEFRNKITLYQTNNHSQWISILSLVKEEVTNQGETLAPFNFVDNYQFRGFLLKAYTWLIRQNNVINIALQNFINNIIIVDCDDLVACSSHKFMGTIVIAPKINWCLADYVENLIHELSHIDLFIRQLIDPIVEKNTLLDSPFRKNKRPTIGVFHAAFVLSRVVEILAILSNERHENALTRLRFLNNYHNLIETLETLNNAPFLTNVGNTLLEEMNEHALLYKDFLS